MSVEGSGTSSDTTSLDFPYAVSVLANHLAGVLTFQRTTTATMESRFASFQH